MALANCLTARNLATAIKRSVGKFFTSEVEVEEIIDEVEEALYDLGESEVSITSNW